MTTAILSADDVKTVNEVRSRIRSKDLESIKSELESEHGYLPVHIKEKLLFEFQIMLSDPGTYLVDQSSGSIMFKIDNSMLIQYPDLKREDGATVKREKVLHPKFTSALALSRHHQIRFERVVKVQPFEAVEHLLEPQSILREAKALSKKANTTLSLECRTELIEIGRENMNGVFQSFNPKFIRAHMYGSQLAKILNQNPEPGYEFLGIKLRSTYKEIWYEVLVRLG